jgi:predicted DCC family thiol-disulfide oxidoreductase YuxK
MRSLTVLFDPGCALCRGARAWLEGQKKYVSLEFVGAGTAEARRRFPELDPASTLKEITVVDEGLRVYRGEKAWLMCLWALREYRQTSLRWSRPDRLSYARRFVAWVSRHRRLLPVPAFGEGARLR